MHLSETSFEGEPVLVADIGGTNARFALIDAGNREDVVLFGIRRYTVAKFESLAAAIRHYLQETDAAPAPRRAVLGVAAPVKGDRIAITNNPWTFSTAELRAVLGLDAITVINDFAANSMSLPYLRPGDVQAIGATGDDRIRSAAVTTGDRTFAIIGPGTGLGVGALLLRGGRAIPVESEGGHASFAPEDSYEFAILESARKHFERVSYERLICGPGLMNLYRAVCDVEGVAPAAQTPEQVTALAGENRDDLHGRTVDLFCGILGACAGDVALMFGAWDGVYIAGGMLQTLMPWLTTDGFRRRFEAKGRFRQAMQAVPTLAVLHPDLGLLGAAARALADSPIPR
ncbi:MAG: glucokinase [Rhodocyclaceae bacterium]|nr:MAG: glucokinase [Rhodocyclaceae bacterium]